MILERLARYAGGVRFVPVHLSGDGLADPFYDFPPVPTDKFWTVLNASVQSNRTVLDGGNKLLTACPPTLQGVSPLNFVGKANPLNMGVFIGNADANAPTVVNELFLAGPGIENITVPPRWFLRLIDNSAVNVPLFLGNSDYVHFMISEIPICESDVMDNRDRNGLYADNSRFISITLDGVGGIEVFTDLGQVPKDKYWLISDVMISGTAAIGFLNNVELYACPPEFVGNVPIVPVGALVGTLDFAKNGVLLVGTLGGITPLPGLSFIAQPNIDNAIVPPNWFLRIASNGSGTGLFPPIGSSAYIHFKIIEVPLCGC